MRDRIVAAWPLWSLLVAQIVLTQRWIWRTAPFTDEALYLQAGHAEWAHWLHHAPLPDYASWFSGAPVLYPPLAAATDSAGGLVAARALSLIVMLATTAMVYMIGSRIFSRRGRRARGAGLRGVRAGRALRSLRDVRAAVPVLARGRDVGRYPDSRRPLRLASCVRLHDCGGQRHQVRNACLGPGRHRNHHPARLGPGPLAGDRPPQRPWRRPSPCSISGW